MLRKQQIILVLLFWASFGLASCNVPTPTLEPIDQFTQAPLVKNVVTRAVVELWASNAPGSLALVATSPPVSSGSTSIRVPLPTHFSPGQIVQARQRLRLIRFIRSAFSDPVVVENNYATQHYDNARTGLNAYETILTTSNAPRLQFLFEQPVKTDDTGPNGTSRYPATSNETEIHAQPLYVQDVQIPGKGKHNIVIVATENNRVYAFDADSKIGLTNSTFLWKYELLGPGENPPVFGECDLQRGITSTPVIDRTTDTLYVVGVVGTATGVKWRIHVVDISTGRNKTSAQGQSIPAKEISATGFLPKFQLNRAGLLLDHGVLYVPFGSHCHDDRPDPAVGFYHGWLMAYDADIPGSATFLNQVGVFNTTEQLPQTCGDDNRYGGGIWQSGIGPAADGTGNIYFATGNGPFNRSGQNFGNSVLKVRLPNPGASPPKMIVSDFFTPTNWTDFCAGDQDLGAGGVMLLPDQPGYPSHLLLARGKLSTIYVVDRDNMRLVQPPLQPSIGQNQFHGQPAYYDGPQGKFVFYARNSGPIERYQLVANPTNPLSPPAVSSPGISTDIFCPQPNPACNNPILVTSSNGTNAGTGIVWGVPGGTALKLYAFNAHDLRQHLFAPRPAGTWAGSNPFTVPTVIHGKVYVASKGKVMVFGPSLTPPPPPITSICEQFPKYCGRINFDHDTIVVLCQTWPCVTFDHIPDNCIYKWNCPGCSPGQLCPPFYNISVDSLPKDWVVGLVNASGESVPHDVFRTRTGAVVSFRPTKEAFLEKGIADYYLVFQMPPGGKPGTYRFHSSLTTGEHPYRGAHFAVPE